MSDTAGKSQRELNEAKAQGFQKEFDSLLLGLLAVGLLIAFLYGLSAGTCPPDPQRAPISVETSSRVSARPAAAPAPAGEALGRAAGNAVAATTSAAARSAAVNQPSACTGGESSSARVVAILLALSISLAALALGALLGFLFGLPRSLTSSDFRAAQEKAAAQENAPAAGQEHAEAAGAPQAMASTSGTEVNTNLEKISDWLTTIIVGVGLTKLQEIPGGIESFGDRVAPYFGYGGKVFGISAGLFFLIGGFFLAYVGTRVKLSLIFLLNQLLHRDAPGWWLQVIRPAIQADPLQSAESTSDEVKEADRILKTKSLSELKTAEEVLAWAKAKARAGDFASALAAFRDVIGQLPQTEKLQIDYAQILAAAGDTAGANNVVASLATISPEAEQQARQKVAAAVQTGQAAAMRTRLQQGLYKSPAERGYDEAIAAGEQLLALPDQPRDAWVHLWLAAAYGQKHAAEKAAATEPPTAAQQQMLDELRAKAVEQVRKALEVDPGVKPILRGLYDPAFRIGDDNDLDSLRPDANLDALLADNPPAGP